MPNRCEADLSSPLTRTMNKLPPERTKPTPSHLPLPSDMQHLLEKRGGKDRRRSSAEADAADGSEAANTPTEKDEAGTDGPPCGRERRKNNRRNEG